MFNNKYVSENIELILQITYEDIDKYDENYGLKGITENLW